MNMTEWLAAAPSRHKPMPVLSFPGAQITGATIRELVHSGARQAECMKAIAERYDMLASVSLMDLSVEAEAFGSPIRFSDDEMPAVTGAVIRDEPDVGKLRVPAVGAARTGEYIDAIRRAKILITDRPILAGSIGPFSLAGRLMDMTEIMVLCYEEPEMVHATLEKVTQFLTAYNMAFREAGADGILMAEPAAGLLSPALIAEFSTPYVKRIIDAVQADDCAFIYHNCGRTIPLVGSILETGARAFHFGNAIDLAEMLPLIPTGFPVFGNVDPAGQICGGSPESVRRATLDVLGRCAQYPHFVLSSGCDIPPAAPMENIDVFFEMAKNFYINR